MAKRRNIFILMLWGSYRRPVIKVIFAFLLFVSALLVGVISIYQLPVIQTKTVHYLSSWFSKKIGMPVTVGSVDINWFREIDLTDVKILDGKGEILIAAGEVRARFNPFTIFRNNTITFNNVRVDQGDVRIVRHDSGGDFNIDLFVAAIRDLSRSDTTVSSSGGAKFVIRKSELHNTSFTLSDPYNDSLKNQFNYNQFRLKNINADLGRLESYQGDFSIIINHLECTDSATQFSVKDLACHYAISDTAMVFDHLNLDAGNSHITASYSFNYRDQDDLKSFNDKITILGEMEKSTIFSKDLGFFAPYFQEENKYYRLEGKFHGQISNFEVRDFVLQFGSMSRLAGNLSMNGLPDFQNTFIDLDIKNSILNPSDLSDYIPPKTFKTVNRFGNSSFIGRFTGFPEDFVAYAQFYTQIGDINSDINFKLSDKSKIAFYTGKLITTNLDLGKLTGNENLLQKADINGFIKGKGLQLNDMDFNLNAEIAKLGINHYDFTGIKTNGRLTSNIFDGFLSIDDPNLKFSANANINLNPGQEKIKVKARLDTALLRPLGLTNQYAFLSTDVDVDLNGLKIDDLRGYMNTSNTYFSYGENQISFNRLYLVSAQRDSLRELTLNNDNINLNITGKFNYTDISNDLPRILNEYKILIRNDSSEVAGYFSKSSRNDTTNYYLNYTLLLKDINPFLHLFNPEISVASESKVAGSIKGGHISEIDMKADIDTIYYRDFILLDNHLKINAEKNTGGRQVTLNMQATSDSQIPQSGPGYSGLLFAVNWNNRKIETHFKINQPEKNNRIDLKAAVDLYPSYTEFKIIPVQLDLLNEPWDITPSHYFVLKGKELNIYDLLIYNKEQSINIYGSISEDSTKSLNVNVNNFKISNLNILLPKNLFGTVNGYVRLEGFYNRPRINSRLFIDSLVIENFYAGDVRIGSIWNNENSAFDMNFNVVKARQRIIDVTGNYYPKRTENQLDFNAKLNDANLNVLEPFFEDLVSNLRGKANGDFTITGNLDNPVLKGTARVTQGNITLDYLNTTYSMDGKVVFNVNEIRLNDINLKDRYNNTGVVSGSISHHGFKDLNYKINGTFKNLNLLNTSAKDNSQYYGTAYGTGNFKLTGQNDNLNITVNATSNSGTRLFIPLNGSESVQQENFIQFTSITKESVQNQTSNNSQNPLSGIRLDFNLEVTPDAYCEIIFDPTIGDILRGRGNGKLSLQIDTKGEFNMFGEYEITEGSYNFTLYNIINKAFTIQPGSTITWSGDPYAATLNVTAEYRQLASLAPIFTQYISRESNPSFYNSPEVQRKYQTAVNLYLKGPLLSPEINFGVNIDYPQNLTVSSISFSTYVSAFENKIESNEQELKRQVFSLILLRRFDEGTFSVSSSDVGSSVSEFISNQLSYWANQVDPNLQVNLDLGTLNQNTPNTFQLTLSYSLAQGRLRITRAGNFYTDQTSNDVSNIIGDWTLEYMLTPEGNLRAKMYNRFNYNSITNPTLGSSTNSTGFSLMQTQGFNRFRDLFSGKNKKNTSRKYIQYDEGTLPSERSGASQNPTSNK